MALSLHTSFNCCSISTCLLICLAHSVRLSVHHGVAQILKIWLSGKYFGDQEEVYQYFVASVS